MQDWLRARAQVTPNKIALIWGQDVWTFTELDSIVDGAAVALIKAGIHQGDFVAALLPNSLNYVCLIHALARIGAVLVPLNTRLTVPELEWQVEHVGCKWLVHDEIFAATAERLNCQLLLVNFRWSTGVSLTIDHQQFSIDNLQSVVFTSGTSGKPKGAMITFANHFWSATASSYRLGVDPDDRWLSLLPLYHVGGLAVIFRSCLYGTAVILQEGFHLDQINASLDTQGITLTSLVPTMLYRLLPTREQWPASLRLILLGGAPATPELIQEANTLTIHHDQAIVAPTYGLTEAASQVATMPPEEAIIKPGSVGKPLLFTTVKIVAENGRECEPGEMGEIVVSGPTVMAGYYEKDSKLKIKDMIVVSESSSINHQSWLHTGDIGHLDEDSDLWVIQRRSDIIISGGENVYPAEIEAVLRQHPAVTGVCVVGVPHPEWGEKVAAAIVLKPDYSEITPDELIEFCRQQLAGYKQPRQVKFMTDLPKTASGKVMGREVAKMLQEQE